VNLPQDGDWFFHVRTLDNAGNWSPTATLPLHLDAVPMKITDPFYRSFAYNPSYDTLPISVSISKPAAVLLTILPDKADSPLRTYDLGSQPAGKVKVEWDGKDQKGTIVPAGNYRFRVVATDRAGNKGDATYDKLLVSNKRIVVSLSQQKLWAYEGDKIDLESLVTTGNQELPTPEGTFQVLSKEPNFVFHSPWPKGSKFWSPDSPTHFAMMRLLPARRALAAQVWSRLEPGGRTARRRDHRHARLCEHPPGRADQALRLDRPGNPCGDPTVANPVPLP